jgi:hypothetical protein
MAVSDVTAPLPGSSPRKRLPFAPAVQAAGYRGGSLGLSYSRYSTANKHIGTTIPAHPYFAPTTTINVNVVIESVKV